MVWRRLFRRRERSVTPQVVRQWIDVWDSDLGLRIEEKRKAAWARCDLAESMRRCRSSREFRRLMTPGGLEGARLLPLPSRIRAEIPRDAFDAAWENPPWMWLGLKPSRDAQQRWNDRVAMARQRKPAVRIAVLALMRNSAATVGFWRSSLDRWLEGWGGASIHILENDSQDDTAGRLLAWGAADRRVEILGKEDIPPHAAALVGQAAADKTANSSRILRMATLRNAVFEAVRRHEPAPDFVCWIDMDRVGIVSETGWLHGLSYLLGRSDLDAVFPQGLDPDLRYYDTLAVIHPQEPWVVREETCRLVMPYKAISCRWFPADDDPLVGVRSAFGGMGWYRWNTTRQWAYAAQEGDGRACEHSFLNTNLTVGIDPWWVTICS